MPPTLGNGKICYIEIPSTDVRRSAAFYEKVFGWQTRQRGDGHLAFDDGVGQVSGTWVLGRPPAAQPGLLVYIMVDSVAATIEAVATSGGRDRGLRATAVRQCRRLDQGVRLLVGQDVPHELPRPRGPDG